MPKELTLEDIVYKLEDVMGAIQGSEARLTETIQALATHMDERFEEAEKSVKARFDQVDRRFAGVDARLARVDVQLIELGVEVATHGKLLRERLGA